MSSKIEIITENELNTFDSLLTKIGNGKYQLLLSFALGTTLMADGAEALVLALVTPIIKEEWNLSNFDLSCFVSLVFFGYQIGAYFSFIADEYGRKRVLIISSTIWL